MTLHDVRCDLCERPGHDPVWIYHTDQFAIVMGTEPTYYRQNEPWGVCAECKSDILADKQNRVMRHRRKVFVDQLGAELDAEAVESVCMMLDLTIIGFFAHRQKGTDRAFSIQDHASAAAEVIESGRDALDRSQKPDTWPDDEGYAIEVELHPSN